MGILDRLRQRRQEGRARVLQAIRDGHDYGLAIMRHAKVGAGSLYVILAELERKGVITSEWEDIDPNTHGRRRRRLNRAT
jgi:DNA-binding PadR family transcriptional regulator